MRSPLSSAPLRRSLRIGAAVAALSLGSAGVAFAQAVPNREAALEIRKRFVMDLDTLQSKFLALADAIPADKYAWRPAQGVRSVGEVLMHVAADNYLLPSSMGHAADPKTGIKGDDYKAAQAFERRQLSRDSTIAELERSFAHVRKSLSGTTAARLGEQVPMFGQKFTVQHAWIMTATHLHEHLGQLIAYARSNGVTPPWSQGG